MKRAIAWSAGVAAMLVTMAWWWCPFGTCTVDDTEVFHGDVLFVTNRELVDAPGPGDTFNGRRGQLRYGRCRVRFQPIPMADGLADQVDFFVPTEIRNVDAVEIFDRDVFSNALDGGNGSVPLPVVLFVHGYSYGFARTCRMGAELQRVLADQARVVMFSWPSDGNPANYVPDQVDVEWSVPQLAGLIGEIEARVGSSRLRLLAHSLGTRGMLFALDTLALDGRDSTVAEHLVLLAPDYDSATFARQIHRFSPLVDRITLYASDNDRPLSVSQMLHVQPRLGQAGEHLTVLPGIETIDVSPLGRYHPSGHEYFFYHPVVADDLTESLVRRTRPGARKHIEERSHEGRPYWALIPPGSESDGTAD
ncbi:MAG: alpha/beta hydrolase [Wenzhouxiangellaceae bacterium]